MQCSKSPIKPALKSVPLIWETEVVNLPNGTIEMKPKRPLHELSIAQAARFLGIPKKAVSTLHREGILNDFEPPANVKRKGRGLRLDAGSVMAYGKTTREAELPPAL